MKKSKASHKETFLSFLFGFIVGNKVLPIFFHIFYIVVILILSALIKIN